VTAGGGTRGSGFGARDSGLGTRTALATMLTAVALMTSAAQEARPRARDLGVEPGVFPPGPLNAITDVAGVRVGQVTLVEGERVRTGVTAVVPHGGNLFQEKVPGAVFVGMPSASSRIDAGRRAWHD